MACTDPQEIPDNKKYLIEQVVTAICIDKVEAYDTNFGGTAPADAYELAELLLARDILASPGSKAIVIAEAAQAERCGDGTDTDWSAVLFGPAKTAIEPIFEIMAYAKFGPAPTLYE